MPEVLHELYVGAQILEHLFLFDLQEGVDARGKEHVCAIGLTVRTCLLQHDGDDSTEVDEHGELSFRGLVPVELHQLAHSMLNPHWVDACLVPCRQV